MLSVIIILSMSLASFANANANQFSSNGSQIESIENADPHTKQYQDMKKILDEYEQEVKKATTCEELDNAAIAMFVKLMATTENTYDQEMTPEEGEADSCRLSSFQCFFILPNRHNSLYVARPRGSRP